MARHLNPLLLLGALVLMTEQGAAVSAAPPDGPVFYFPLANASLVVPVLLPPGTALLRTRALPLPALSAGGRPNYRLRRGAPPWLQASLRGQDVVLSISDDVPLRPGTSHATLEARLRVTDSAQAPQGGLWPAEQRLEFRVLGDEETRSLCAANNSTATLCFWQSMDMQLLEESPGVDLGPPGPTYLQNFCRQTFRYRLDDESSSDALAVRPPEAPDGEWRLQSTRPLDREADAAAPGGGPTQHARLLCSAAGAGGGEGHKEAGHAVDVRVQLIDRDDNPPEKQASDLVVYLGTNHLLKRSQYAQSDLIMFDKDSSQQQRYEGVVLKDPLELWDFHCGPPLDITFRWRFEHSVIRCYITPLENRTLLPNSEHNLTLLVNDVTMESLHAGVDGKVRLPLTLVAGQRPALQADAPAPAATAAPTTPTPASTRARATPRNPYPRAVALPRWAARLARVATPRGWTARRRTPAPGGAFSLLGGGGGGGGALAVTPQQGIVYVRDAAALARAPANFTVTVAWRSSDGADAAEWDVRVRLLETGNASACALHGAAARFPHCADFASAQHCAPRCGLGAGSARPINKKGEVTEEVAGACTWRSIGPSRPQAHAMYSTCTPDVPTCPDGECDELERKNPFLCPQDCVLPDPSNLHMAYNAHGRGIEKAPGICSCSLPHNCVCFHEAGPRPTAPAPKAPAEPPPPPPPSPSPASPASPTAPADGDEDYPFSSTVPATPDVVLLGHTIEQCGASCVMAVIAGSVVLLGGTAGLIFWRYRSTGKGRGARKLAASQAASLEAAAAAARRRPSGPLGAPYAPADGQRLMPVPDAAFVAPDPRWEFPRKQLTLEQPLGEGEFGRVLRARALNIAGYSGYTTVAVKTLKEGACAGELADLLSEFALLQQVRHPNVVRLLGACSAGCAAGEPFLLIIEFAEHGSLRSYLRRSRHAESDGALPCSEPDALALAHAAAPRPRAAPPRRAPPPATPRDVLGFAWQIAKGMAYLSDIKLVHRDLAARNVLVAEGGICKISDFGLTRDVYEDDTYMKRSKGRVPVKWMSLESLADHMYTSKSDVWSFGVLLWELVTLGASPYPGVAVHNLFHLLKAGYRMQRPDNCSPALYRIMRSCWNESPDDRPTFKELTSIFEKMLQDGVDYLDLNPRSVHNMTYFTSLSSARDILDDADVHYGNLTMLPTDSVNYLTPHKSRKDSSLCLTLSSAMEEEEKLLHTPAEIISVDTTELEKSTLQIEAIKGDSPKIGNAYLSPIRQTSSQTQDTSSTSPSPVALTQRYISMSVGEPRYTMRHISPDSSPRIPNHATKVSTF